MDMDDDALNAELEALSLSASATATAAVVDDGSAASGAPTVTAEGAAGGATALEETFPVGPEPSEAPQRPRAALPAT